MSLKKLSILFLFLFAFNNIQANDTLRVVITLDYQYNLLGNGYGSGSYVAGGMSYAATYIDSYRKALKNKFILLNSGEDYDPAYDIYSYYDPRSNVPEKINNRFRYSNDKIIEFAGKKIGFIVYDDLETFNAEYKPDFLIVDLGKDANVFSLAGKIEADIIISRSDNNFTDSVFVEGRKVHVLNCKKGEELVVIDFISDGSEIKIKPKRVSVKDFYPSRDFDAAFAVNRQRINELKDTLSICLPCSGDPLQTLLGSCDYSDLIHNFQIATTRSDLSIFSLSSLSVMDSCCSVSRFMSLFSGFGRLLTVKMKGSEFIRLAENNYERIYNKMPDKHANLLKLSAEDNESLNLRGSVRNVLLFGGFDYQVNVRAGSGGKIKTGNLANGKVFHKDSVYVVAIPESLLSNYYFRQTEFSDIRTVGKNYCLDLMKWLNGNEKDEHMVGRWHLTPQGWDERTRREIFPMINRN